MKRILLTLLACLSPLAVAAQGVPIGALPQASLPLSGSELAVLSQNGASVKATVAQINVSALGQIANNTVLGNVSGSTAAPVAINAAQLSALLGLGTAAFQNTGSSGQTIPFLNGVNTWSGFQTFAAGASVTGTITVSNLAVVGTSTLGTGTASPLVVTSTGISANIASAAGTIELLPNNGTVNLTGSLAATAGLTAGTRVLTANGTATAPSYAFTNATDAGIYLTDPATHAVEMRSGTVAGVGGTTYVIGGSAGATGTAGEVLILGGAGGTTSGPSGNVTVKSGFPTDGNAGKVTIQGANAVGTNRNGGSVELTAGAPTGGGTPGNISVIDSAGLARIVANTTSTTFAGAVALSPANAAVTVSPTGTGTVTVSPATAGTMNNMVIGGSTAAAGTFTALTATGAVALSPANANVVISPTGTGLVTIAPATAGSLNNVVIGASTPLAITSTALTATGAVSLSPASANVVLSPTGTGVVTINPATAGTINNVVIGGSTALAITGTTITASTAFRGTDIGSGSTSSVNLTTSGGTQLRVLNRNSAAAFVGIIGATTGNPPAIRGLGETNTGLEFGTMGAGAFDFYTGDFNSRQVAITHTASATRYITLTGSNGGNPTISVSAGSLAITPAIVGASTITVTGVTVTSGSNLITSSAAFTNGAAASLGTLTNAPTAGNPTKWIPVNDNGTTRYLPAW